MIAVLAVPLRVGRMLLAVAAASIALAVLWMAASAHVRYGCAVADTPYLPLCPEGPAGEEEQQALLRERIQRNPGDAWSWAKLLAVKPQEPSPVVLRAATALAPNNPLVLRSRAVSALEHDDLAQGVALLVQLQQYRNSPEAANALARILATPEGPSLLQPHLNKSRVWLPRVIVAMQRLELPPEAALPAVVEAARHEQLPLQARRHYIQWLKGSGRWLDAYGLWLALHKQEVPLLYNGSFDNQFIPDGFDWEFTPLSRSRSGVLYEQAAVAKRGLVMGLEFTGRRLPTPVLRQYVFVPPGSYKLSGQYSASKLRSEGGLTWAVVCTANRRPVPVQASPIQDTGGLWRSIDVDFRVPGDCGAVASLHLEPVHKYEITTGIKGRVELDAFSLTRTGD